ncbi:MAG: MotA/TolQ/ExbB proton channel family protein [Sneathiella sp.]|nr:MotA/TolQ/ExbB proton channel family protein [Sneathiella sp.]
MLPDIYLKLGIMGLPLVACSVLATMVCLERLIFFLFVDFNGRKLTQKGLQILRLHKHKDKALREEIVAVAMEEAKRPFGRGLSLLRLIAAISPILGLLGTILGIIDAFRVIAASTNPVTPNMIADGLWEALLTTAFGLMIALPTLILASGFIAWRGIILERTSTRLNAFSLEIDLDTARPQIDGNTGSLIAGIEVVQ